MTEQPKPTSAQQRVIAALVQIPYGEEYGGAYRAVPYRLAIEIAEVHAAAAVAELREKLAGVERERDEARTFAEEACRLHNELLEAGKVLRCAFCDEEYPAGTPPTQHEALTAHVSVCSKHPMRAAEQSLAASRAEVARLKERWSRVPLELQLEVTAALAGAAAPKEADDAE